jgi:hypothetical protein
MVPALMVLLLPDAEYYLAALPPVEGNGYGLEIAGSCCTVLKIGTRISFGDKVFSRGRHTAGIFKTGGRRTATPKKE